MTTPDSWSIIKITRKTGELEYKVFAGWAGGYLNGDSWKLNSGIKSYRKLETAIEVDGYSGSCYYLPFNGEGRHTSYNFGVLNSLFTNAEAAGVEIKTISLSEFLSEFNNE